MTTVEDPLYASFKVSKAIRDELPEKEKPDAAEHLLNKASGRCALCNEPLPTSGRGIDIDHVIARQEGSGGTTVLANLYLAHKECNRSRRNLRFDLAKAVIRFSKWCKSHTRRSFADVVEKYVAGGNQPVGFIDHGSEIELTFGSDKRKAPVYTDPATATRYFFMNAPVEFIMNDDETQPRHIEHDHVRALAIDFDMHPVHEPSNCRLISTEHGVARLLQFDGQHKTTAQIVLGRTEVPMKFYVEPNEPMIQELVVQIQQGIKKRPLSTSDTLRKLDDVISDKVEAFKAEHGGVAPTEIELVNAQPKEMQSSFKKRLLSNFEYAVLNDESLLFKKYFSSKKDRQFPLTDTVLVKKLIHPLVSQELMDQRLDDSTFRDTERETVIWLLNLIADEVLVGKWQPTNSNEEEDLATRRARNFFYQGSIGWWLSDVLLVALSLIIPRARFKKLFIEELDSDQQDRIEAYVSTLTSWSIWSTDDKDQLAAMRSNTVSRVAAAFPEYDQTRLIRESQEG